MSRHRSSSSDKQQCCAWTSLQHTNEDTEAFPGPCTCITVPCLHRISRNFLFSLCTPLHSTPDSTLVCFRRFTCGGCSVRCTRAVEEKQNKNKNTGGWATRSTPPHCTACKCLACARHGGHSTHPRPQYRADSPARSLWAGAGTEAPGRTRWRSRPGRTGAPSATGRQADRRRALAAHWHPLRRPGNANGWCQWGTAAAS